MKRNGNKVNEKELKKCAIGRAASKLFAKKGVPRNKFEGYFHGS